MTSPAPTEEGLKWWFAIENGYGQPEMDVAVSAGELSEENYEDD